MLRRSYHLMAPALLSLPALAWLAGGWAVVTVEQLPEYVEAGKPVTLAFVVRQHGVTPLNGLHPTIEARSGSLEAKASAEPGKETGRYLVSLSLPEPGDWTLTIHSGFGNSRLTLLPLRAVTAGTAAPVALAEGDRGRHLFVAKGCVACQMRNEVDRGQSLAIAPDLTGRRYPADYLRRFLADPSVAQTGSGSFRMPNLGLKQPEIASLVAFINSERTAAAR